MAWYKTGTADFTNGSAAIIGHGTEWVANAAPGEAMAGPDGRFYEIQSVNSNTSITLARPYSGASLAGQAYDILPSQSHIRDLAAQAAALINNNAAGRFVDGTVALPGISFASDTNTGLRRVSDGVFRVVSNGVDVAEIGPGGVTGLIGIQPVSGTTTLNGIDGVTITHNLGSTNYLVKVSPIGSAPGDAGEISVVKASNTCTIYNTGRPRLVADYEISARA